MMKNKNESGLPDNVVSGQVELHKYMESVHNKKNYADFPEMNHNPFLCLLADDLSHKWVRKGNSGITSTSVSRYTCSDSGEEVALRKKSGGILFEEEKYVDDAEFTKVFKNQLRHMFSLSSTALKLFGYFLGELDHKDNNGMVYMSMQDGMTFCEYTSRGIVYKGLTELIQKGFICKTDRPWTFYVNPKYAFNGDRVAMFTQFIRKPGKNELASSSIERSIENW